MSNCVDRLIKIVQDVKTPFTIEVIKSIANLCDEDPYKLWHNIASLQLTQSVNRSESVDNISSQKSMAKDVGWKCTVCGKFFNDVGHLVNHITFFVRQRDKAHIELYKKIKEYADKNNKTFTQATSEILKS